MQTDPQDLPALVKEVRRQLSLSQEGPARELGVSFATVNRWENGQAEPSKLARAQLDDLTGRQRESLQILAQLGPAPLREIRKRLRRHVAKHQPRIQELLEQFPSMPDDQS